MSTKILDYTLDSLTPANPDTTKPATVADCTVVAGPGATPLGTFPKALDFSAGGTLQVELTAGVPPATKFVARIAFKPGGAVAARETLLASATLPIALYIEPGSGSSEYHLVAAVTTQAHGTGAASTQYLMDLKIADWHTADLVYDTDTVAVFVDDKIVSVHAFPDGTLIAGATGNLYAGVGANGTDHPFKGQIAALQLHDDIPIELEAQLDERRAHPQWHLTYKQEEMNLDNPDGEFYLDLPSDSWIQEFAGTWLMYHETTGQAFEMHGALLQAYAALPYRIQLGFLISDEMDTAKAGGRKSLFSRGGFYWSPGTGAVPVLGQMWVDYESMGESKVIGHPLSPVQAISGGRRQLFQGGHMYQKGSTAKAFEVHGDILAKFLATGGTAKWGFPITNESDVKEGAAVIGRQSEFEYCAIFWRGGIGAFEVHGDIRVKYNAAGGPGGKLGFPTSDESDIPGASGRYNTFQNGSIVWFGSMADTFVCVPFQITLTRVHTNESEPVWKGENDVFLHASIEENGHVLHTERMPGSGDSDGNNIFTKGLPKTFDLGPAGIVPNDPNRNINFHLEIWDDDWPDDNDYLGTFNYALNMANAWGLRDSPSGVFNSGAFDKIASVSWSVGPKVDITLLTEAEKWWGCRNQGTDPITYAQYAAAFSDVDSDSDWWDPADWLSKLFYEAVCSGLADKGNCFGMSLEAIYSKKRNSGLTLPINRFDDSMWEAIRNEFNIKHQYQVGAPAIWWFVGQFLSGNTHDPVDVFKETRALHAAGCDPVLCIAQNWDFSGKPHCVLPVAWNDSVTPWQLSVRDPNNPTMSDSDPPQIIEVDPSANTYNYKSGLYKGGEWSGGRMHYMPWEMLNERPRTPVFEAIMLLLSGVILILGGDSETASLTDENGVDLDAFGADSINRMKLGKPLTNKFVPVRGFDQRRRRECSRTNDGPRPERPPPDDFRPPRTHGVLTSELYLRSEPKTFSRTPPTGGKRSGDDWKRITLYEYLCQLAPHDIREKFASNPEFVAANNHRLMYTLTDARLVKEVMSAALANRPASGAVSKNYIHTVRATRRGQMQYGIKEGLGEVLLMTDTSQGDQETIRVKDLGTHMKTISVSSTRDKPFRVLIDNHLGAGRDRLRIDIDGVKLPAGKELQINVRPGIGGVELVSSGQIIEANVQLHYVRHGMELRSKFALKERDGLRVMPSTYITSNKLKVSKIDALFGAAKDSKMVTAMP